MLKVNFNKAAYLLPSLYPPGAVEAIGGIFYVLFHGTHGAAIVDFA